MTNSLNSITSNSHASHLITTKPEPTLEENHINQIGQARIPSHSSSNQEQHEWGEVIVLLGTSTAGKSTIIAEMLKQKPEMLEKGVDLAFDQIPMAYLNENHADELDYLNRVIEFDDADKSVRAPLLDYILFNKKVNFKVGISEEDKGHYRQIIAHLEKSLTVSVPGETVIPKMLDQILLSSQKGTSVVFDVLNIKEIAEHELLKKHPTLKLALVYLPFETLAERITIRNHEAVQESNLGNARPGIFPLMQFAKIFRPAKEGEEVIQTLSLKDATHAIDTAYQSGKSYFEKFSPENISRLDQDNTEMRGKILKKLGFEEGDSPDKTVSLTPRFNGYHMLVSTTSSGKTKEETVQESVKTIFKK